MNLQQYITYRFNNANGIVYFDDFEDCDYSVEIEDLSNNKELSISLYKNFTDELGLYHEYWVIIEIDLMLITSEYEADYEYFFSLYQSIRTEYLANLN